MQLLKKPKTIDGANCRATQNQNKMAPSTMKSVEDFINTSRNVLRLLEEHSLTIVQINGQRKLGGPPPGWEGPPPGPECEVFVGKIPRDLYEDTLYDIFTKVGSVYEIRLMMNFSGTNRGFCFVMYSSPEEARRAIKELNNYEIEPGRYIGVVASVNNCRLCITRLPNNLNTAQFIKKIWMLTDDIKKITVYRTNTNKPKMALIQFLSHRGAAMARRRLLPEKGNICQGVEIGLDWAYPKMNVSNSIEESGYVNERGDVVMTTVLKPDMEKKKSQPILKKGSRNTSQLKEPFYVEKNRRNKNYKVKKELGNVPINIAHHNNSFKLFDQFTFSENIPSKGTSSENTNWSNNLSVQSEISIPSSGSTSSFSNLNFLSSASTSSAEKYPDFSANGYPSMHSDTSQKDFSFRLNPLDCSVMKFPWYLMDCYKHGHYHQHEYCCHQQEYCCHKQEYCCQGERLPWKEPFMQNMNYMHG